MICFLGVRRLIHHKIIEGIYNSEKFIQFVNEIREDLINDNRYSVFIMDHAIIIRNWFAKNYLSMEFLHIYFHPSLQGNPMNSVDIIERTDSAVLSVISELLFENYYNRVRMFLNKAFFIKALILLKPLVMF